MSSTTPVAGLKPFIMTNRPGERTAHVSQHNDDPSVTSTFETPSYLRYSSLRDKLVTEAPANSPPSRYSGGSSERVYRPFHLNETSRRPSRRRDFTPCSDSDDDSERSSARGLISRREQVMRARGRERPSAAPSIMSAAGAEKPWNPQERATLLLPTRWSEQDRSSSLNLSQDGRELLFPGTIRIAFIVGVVVNSPPSGPGSSTEDRAAAARADHPIPPACGIYYYEVEIVNGGQKRYVPSQHSLPFQKCLISESL